MDAANATRIVLAFFENRFDTDKDSAVRNDIDGFLTRRAGFADSFSGRTPCLVKAGAAPASSGTPAAVSVPAPASVSAFSGTLAGTPACAPAAITAAVSVSGAVLASGSNGWLSDFTFPSRSLMIRVA